MLSIETCQVLIDQSIRHSGYMHRDIRHSGIRHFGIRHSGPHRGNTHPSGRVDELVCMFKLIL